MATHRAMLGKVIERATNTHTIPHTTGRRLVRGSGDGWAYPVRKRVSSLLQERTLSCPRATAVDGDDRVCPIVTLS